MLDLCPFVGSRDFTQDFRKWGTHEVSYVLLLHILDLDLVGPNLGRVPGGGGMALLDLRGTQLLDMVGGKGRLG